MRWIPHKSKDGTVYVVNHLHPFQYRLTLQAKNNLPEMTVQVHVAFGMHCFTKQIQPGDCPGDLYSDAREQRTFEHLRYTLSKELPKIARTLTERHCAFAKNQNYVTVDCTASNGIKYRYGVFFNMKQIASKTILVTIQSAYPFETDKAEPGQGRIRFNVLIGHTLRGTRPKAP